MATIRSIIVPHRQQYKAWPRSGFLQHYSSSSLAHAFPSKERQLGDVGGDAPGFVAGDALPRPDGK
jgi:hypothetical protein